MGDFMYMKLEGNSYWQVDLNSLKLFGAVVSSTPYAIVGVGTSLLPQATAGLKSIAASLSFFDRVC